jgi:hypothetical protein
VSTVSVKKAFSPKTNRSSKTISIVIIQASHTNQMSQTFHIIFDDPFTDRVLCIIAEKRNWGMPRTRYSPGAMACCFSSSLSSVDDVAVVCVTPLDHCGPLYV